MQKYVSKIVHMILQFDYSLNNKNWYSKLFIQSLKYIQSLKS